MSDAGPGRGREGAPRPCARARGAAEGRGRGLRALGPGHAARGARPGAEEPLFFGSLNVEEEGAPCLAASPSVGGGRAVPGGHSRPVPCRRPPGDSGSPEASWESDSGIGFSTFGRWRKVAGFFHLWGLCWFISLFKPVFFVYLVRSFPKLP